RPNWRPAPRPWPVVRPASTCVAAVASRPIVAPRSGRCAPNEPLPPRRRMTVTGTDRTSTFDDRRAGNTGLVSLGIGSVRAVFRRRRGSLLVAVLAGLVLSGCDALEAIVGKDDEDALPPYERILPRPVSAEEAREGAPFRFTAATAIHVADDEFLPAARL